MGYFSDATERKCHLAAEIALYNEQDHLDDDTGTTWCTPLREVTMLRSVRIKISTSMDGTDGHLKAQFKHNGEPLCITDDLRNPNTDDFVAGNLAEFKEERLGACRYFNFFPGNASFNEWGLVHSGKATVGVEYFYADFDQAIYKVSWYCKHLLFVEGRFSTVEQNRGHVNEAFCREAVIDADGHQGKRYLKEIQVTTMDGNEYSAPLTEISFALVWRSQDNGNYAMFCETKNLVNNDNENFEAGTTDIYYGTWDNFKTCKDVNFYGMRIVKYLLKVKKGKKAWGAQSFTLLFSDNSYSSCIIDNVVEYEHECDPVRDEAEGTFSNNGTVRKLQEIVVETVQVNNIGGQGLDPTLEDPQLKLQVMQYEEELCKTDVLSANVNSRGEVMRPGQFTHFRYGFGNCDNINFDKVLFDNYGILYEGQAPWLARSITLRFTDGSVVGCYTEYDNLNTGTNWCNKKHVIALAKIEVVTSDTGRGSGMNSGTLMLQINLNKGKFCKTDDLIKHSETVIPDNSKHIFVAGFGDCASKQFRGFYVSNFGLIHTGSDDLRISEFNLHFTDGSIAACPQRGRLLNSEIWCDDGSYLTEVQIENSRNCDTTMNRGAVTVSMSNDDEVLCKTGKLRDDSQNSNFEAGCIDIHHSNLGSCRTHNFEQDANKPINRLTITMDPNIEPEHGQWGFSSFTLVYHNNFPILCWGNRYLKKGESFTCYEYELGIAQIQFDVSDKPNAGIGNKATSIQVEIHQGDNKHCSTGAITSKSKHYYNGDIFQKGKRYVISGLDAPHPNGGPHPVMGTCYTELFDFDKVSRIAVRHNQGPEALLLNYIHVSFTNGMSISCHVGKPISKTNSFWHCDTPAFIKSVDPEDRDLIRRYEEYRLHGRPISSLTGFVLRCRAINKDERNARCAQNNPTRNNLV